MDKERRVCELCGRPTDAHDRHVRFRLPDPVEELPEQEHVAGTWMSHDDPEGSVMLQVPGVGPFVRSLLPVRLTGGFTVTFGIWLAVHPDEFQRAFSVWWEAEYRDLVLEGWIANALPGWGLLAAPAVARVENPAHTPYIAHSSDEGLQKLLAEEWTHDQVLEGLP